MKYEVKKKYEVKEKDEVKNKYKVKKYETEVCGESRSRYALLARKHHLTALLYQMKGQ